MRNPKNGRGHHPIARFGTSYRLWTLDEASGATACLLSKASATAIGTPATATGPIGKMKTFDGTEAYRYDDAGASATAVQGDWTAGAWVMFDTLPTSSAREFFLAYSGDNNDTTPQNILMGLNIKDDSGTPRIGCYGEEVAGANVDTLVSAANFTPKAGQWYYIVWTKEDVDATYCDMVCYVNGVAVESFSSVVQSTDGSDAEWTIGGRQNAGAIHQGLTGKMCSAFWYGEVLTATEIQEDFRRGMFQGFHTAITPKVEIEDSAAAMQDMSDYFGEDWINSVTYNFGVDDAVATVSVDMAREIGQLSTAILRTDSALNIPDLNVLGTVDQMVTIGRDLHLKFARTPSFVDPDSGDYHTLFKGEIDEVDNGGNKTSIKARDDAWALVDTYIEEVQTYGSAGGIAVETEMQSILDDNDGTNTIYNFTLYTPTSPSWNVVEWEQRREPVMTALKTIAGQIGWDVRYKYRADTDTFAVTFYDPDRLKGHPDGIIATDDIKSVSKLFLSRQDVRNVVRVVFPSSEDETTSPTDTTVSTDLTLDDGAAVGLTSEGKRTPAFVEVKHAGSITEFGRRFMELAEGSASQIDTFAEATKMAEGACLDLASPNAEYSAELFLSPEVEIQDLITLQANHWLHTADQNLATQTISHKFGNQEGTSVSLRGQPTVGFKRWLQMETRPGMGRQPVKDPTQTLAGYTSNQGLVSLDALDTTTRRGYNQRFVELRNHNFSDSSKGTAYPPDGWSLTSGTWGSSVSLDTTNFKSGGRSIKILPTRGINTELFPIFADGTDTPYKVEALCYSTTASVDVSFDVSWYDEDKVGISTSTYSTDTSTASTWIKLGKYDLEPPSGAAFAKVFFYNDETLTGNVYVDHITFTQADYNLAVGFHSATPLSPNAVAGSWWSVSPHLRGGSALIDAGDCVASYTSGSAVRNAFKAPKTGVYSMTMLVNLKDNFGGTAPTSIDLRFVKGGSFTVSGTYYYNSSTQPTILSQSPSFSWVAGTSQNFFWTSTAYLDEGDEVTGEIYFDTGTTTNFTVNNYTGGAVYTFLAHGSRDLFDGS